jgi:hypothetical protein
MGLQVIKNNSCEFGKNFFLSPQKCFDNKILKVIAVALSIFVFLMTLALIHITVGVGYLIYKNYITIATSHKVIEDRSKSEVVNPKTNYVKTSLDIDISAYKALSGDITKESVIVKDTNNILSEETLLDMIGSGGSKKAYKLSKGRALLLPNFSDSCQIVANRWERMVLEEVAMSKIISSLGLLSPLCERVDIVCSTSDETSEKIIPAYICQSFEQLALSGCFIIDTKNRRSSTWKMGENYLFKTEDERLSQTKWESILDLLVTDIAKICFYDIPTDFDSLNIAIVKKSDDKLQEGSSYEVRYFGFDFSSKCGSLSIPTLEKKEKLVVNEEDIEKILNHILTDLIYYECFDEFDIIRTTLLDLLVKKLIPKVKKTMESYHKERFEVG